MNSQIQQVTCYFAGNLPLFYTMILSIDTSTAVCSIALHEVAPRQLVFSTTLQIERAHSTALTQLIAFALEQCGIAASQLSAVAVASGPGSYTGLRIGASVAKGICYAADIPLIALPTLECMAQRALQYAHLLGTNSLLCPMIDARRMEVYTALFTHHLAEHSPTQAKVIDEHSFSEILAQYPILFFGDGAAKCQPVLTHPNALFLQGITPHAEQVGELAMGKLAAQQFEDTAYFEPFYLKAFEAKKPAKNKLLGK